MIDHAMLAFLFWLGVKVALLLCWTAWVYEFGERAGRRAALRHYSESMNHFRERQAKEYEEARAKRKQSYPPESNYPPPAIPPEIR